MMYVVGIALTCTAGEAVYVPFDHDQDLGDKQVDRKQALESLRSLMEDTNVVKIAFDMKHQVCIYVSEC